MKTITEESKKYSLNCGIKDNNDICLQFISEAYEEGYLQCINTVLDFWSSKDLDEFEDAINKLYNYAIWK